MEEVVVTAQKRKENLADVPISIQAFSSDSLEARGVNSTADLPRITPGLTVTTQINFTATFLRGIGSDAWLLGDPSVVTYTDGVYNPFAIGQTSDFGDIERVEILKGPQGTLFGRNAIGGALNIITAEPSFEEVYLSAQGEYASFNKQKFSLSINAPVGSRFAINLAGFYSEADDHRDGRINGSPLPREELKSGRIKALWQVADNFELGLNVTRLDQN
ncbi:MAG: TonB-dependent receptor, partial [Spongiibacter sp.]